MAYEHANPAVGPNPFEPMVDGNLMLMTEQTSSSFSFPFQVNGQTSASNLIVSRLPDGGGFISLSSGSEGLSMGGGKAIISARVNHAGLVDGGLYS